MNRNKRPAFLPILLLFIIMNALFITGKSFLQRIGADQEVLLYGNLFIGLISLVSFLISQKGIRNPNAHGFIRGMYGGIMLKLFACIILAFVYIASVGKQVNKPALFICMGLYLVYSFVEVSLLTKLLKVKPDAQERSSS
ncbi:MAG TPA: hypothetical protein VM935_02715 [Chitinophagaceae bacterium]|nr:hypothetical protein [Chitinophagaceae bacterium]